jgi:anti-anti-sigma factor
VRLKQLVQDNVQVFALEGEIDFHYSPVLRAMFQAKLKENCPALVLDFAAVRYIDSRGIATVIEYLRDCARHGGTVCLAALHPDVKPIIDTVRLETVMPIFARVDDAVAAMNRHLDLNRSKSRDE